MKIKIFAPILNNLSHISDVLKSQITDWLRQEEAYNRLRMILASTDEHKKALGYYENSKWSLQQIEEFVHLTGQIPPEEFKNIPYETIKTLNFVVRFDSKSIEDVKRGLKILLS